MATETNLSDLVVGDPVVLHSRFRTGRAGRVHKVTEDYLYVELINSANNLPYVSCIKFRRTDGKAFRGRAVSAATYHLRRAERTP